VFGTEFWDVISSALYRYTYEEWMSAYIEFWNILLPSTNIFILSLHVGIHVYNNLIYLWNKTWVTDTMSLNNQRKKRRNFLVTVRQPHV